MNISDDFILNLKSICTMDNIISKYTVLKSDGRNKKCLCLFHSEKTPSMIIYDDTQSFYCFGCNSGGDVITFIMKIENLDYIEAIKFLCDIAGIKFPDSNNNNQDHGLKLKNEIYKINRESALYYYKQLYVPKNTISRQYLHFRGLDDNIIRRFGLGFAPNSWNSLLNYLLKKGYDRNLLEQAGVVSKNKNGKYYDVFRNRIIFPILDIRGNVIGFGGRVLDDAKPKYINSRDTIVFKKSKNLYNMHTAKNNITDNIILTEGYMDVISLSNAKISNSIATLGTALTEDQAILISRYTKQVILAYDSDNAGKLASSRAYQFLSKYGIDVRILNMTGAKDPDEYLKKFGPKKFAVIAKRSSNIIDFELLNLKSKYNLNHDQDKINYIKECVKAFSKILNPIDREVYILKLSSETNFSKDIIQAQVDSFIKKATNKAQNQKWKEIHSSKKITFNNQQIDSDSVKRLKAEQGIIYFIMYYQDQIDYISDKLDANYFTNDFNKNLFKYLTNTYKLKGKIDISLLSKDFEPHEISIIFGIISSFREIVTGLDQLFDYLNILIKFKNQLKDDDIVNMTPEQIKSFIYKDKL